MKEKIDERIKNIPDKIYLQVGDNVGWDVDFKELESTGEVTWCSDKIENWDIEYIRASEFEHLVDQEVERRIKEMMSDEEIRIIAINYAPPLMYSMGDTDEDVNYSIRNDVIGMLTALRSRLTPQVTPQDTPQVEKTEGGGE